MTGILSGMQQQKKCTLFFMYRPQNLYIMLSDSVSEVMYIILATYATFSKSGYLASSYAAIKSSWLHFLSLSSALSDPRSQICWAPKRPYTDDHEDGKRRLLFDPFYRHTVPEADIRRQMVTLGTLLIWSLKTITIHHCFVVSPM